MSLDIKEIFVHHEVLEDEITKNILKLYDGKIEPIIVKDEYDDTKSKKLLPSDIIRKYSKILTFQKSEGKSIRDKYIAGKQILYISPATSDVVQDFKLSNEPFVCPEFTTLRLASNGCPFKCKYCYLRGTYRAQTPFITVRVQYGKIEKMIEERMNKPKFHERPLVFNAGELADSLALEDLTGSAKHFITWFGKQEHKHDNDNAYLYLLTKSDNVDDILELPHNGKTILTWSINNEEVTNMYECGSAKIEARLQAAKKAQDKGYKVRVRLDPIILIDEWQKQYSQTIETIFKTINPERITLGTLRFEENLYRGRKSYFDNDMLKIIDDTMIAQNDKKNDKDKIETTKSGKYTYPKEKRIELFKYIIEEIRKHSQDIPISLCKEIEDVWKDVGKDFGIDNSDCKCVCKYDSVNASKPKPQIQKDNKGYKPPKGETYTIGNLYPLDINKLKPNPAQPRKYFDNEEMLKLQDSIRKYGVIEPILFTKDNNGYLVIVAGERRYQACKNLNKPKIPAIFTDGKVDEKALVENIIRQDLSPVEFATALNELKVNHNLNHKELSEITGKARNTITEILRINELPPEILEFCKQNNKCSMSTLVELSRLEMTDDEKIQVFKSIISKDSTRGDIRNLKKKETVEEPTNNTAKIVSIPVLKDKIRSFNKLLNIDMDNLSEDEKVQISSQLEDFSDMLNVALRKLKG